METGYIVDNLPDVSNVKKWMKAMSILPKPLDAIADKLKYIVETHAGNTSIFLNMILLRKQKTYVIN